MGRAIAQRADRHGTCSASPGITQSKSKLGNKRGNHDPNSSHPCLTESPGYLVSHYLLLKWLADYQATARDDYHDAQPGKTLHEIRFGELAYFNEIPHTPYYGTVDATILYLIVLSETFRWTGDVALLKQYHDVAQGCQGCLQWIDQYGDLDGDGFQKYKTFSSSPGSHKAS